MDLLKIGQKLSILFQKNDAIVEIGCVISELYDDRIVIELPKYFMRYIEYLDVGCTLTIKVFSKIGTIDFNTVVITSPLEDEFSVELDSNALKLTPGRDLPVIDDIINMDITLNDSTFFARTFQISTEYIKFYSDHIFNINDFCECNLNLPQNCGTIKFKGAINYVDPVYDNEFQIIFSIMSDVDRQNLLYYMYLYSNNSN